MSHTSSPAVSGGKNPMKFTIAQSQLNQALGIVSSAVTGRSTLSILKGILLQVGSDGTLTLTGSDNELRIDRRVEVLSSEPGSVVLNAKLFADIIRRLPNVDVTLETIDEKIVQNRTESSRFQIVSIPSDEYPSSDSSVNGQQLSIPTDTFVSMIKKTAFAASKDESRGVIVGILLECSGNQLTMVSLDGFRLSAVTEEIPESPEHSMIISAKILNDAANLLSGNSFQDEAIDIQYDSRKAVIQSENTTITMSLINGKFLDYKNLLPTAFKTEIRLSRSDLLKSAERASLMSNEGRNNLIVLNFDEHTLKMTSSSESGNVDEELPIELQGEKIRIGFNSKYLIEVLKLIEDDEITLHLNSGILPCVIQPEAGGFRYMILPVRVNS